MKFLEVLLLIFFTVAISSGDYPFRDVSLDWAARVDDLVSRLSLDEIGLQMARGGGGDKGGPAPAIERLGIKQFQWNTECLRGVVRHEKATSFPQSINLGAMFDWRMMNKVASAVGMEARAKNNNNTAHGVYNDFSGINCWAPMINMMRHPLWGRNQEVYGEDPFLTGRYAEVYVQGLQGTDQRYVQAAANCKAFVAYAGPDATRQTFNAVITERDLRLTFLPAFKRCVGAGTFSYMCSYNSVNGVPMCVNKRILGDILRGEWGFQGYVVSDMEALENVVKDHKFYNTTDETVAAALTAGVNLELSGDDLYAFYTNITDVVKKGLVSESLVRERVKPLFFTRMRLGEFDPDDMNLYRKFDVSLVQSPAHRNLAVKAAMKSFVLLKNLGLLPLRKHFSKVAMVGPMTNNLVDLYGNYATTVDPRYAKTVLQGLSGLADTVGFGPGCEDTKCTHYKQSNVTNAIDSAQLIVVSLGTGLEFERESVDRQDMELPGHQADILRDAMQYGQGIPIILLLFSAGPLNITFADSDPRVSAILQCFFPAQGTGDALYNTLTMATPDSSPAGRLPYTWYRTAEQIPSMTNYGMTERTYRYFTGIPAYPFGFGLSYSTFYYSNLLYDLTITKGQQRVLVQVDVTNTGSLPAEEVVQVYVSWATTQELMPHLQLVGFDRQLIGTGLTITVKFAINAEDLAVWTDNTGFIVEKGQIFLYVGGQQPGQVLKLPSNILQGTITVEDTYRL